MKRRTNPSRLSVSDRVKAIADGYINTCFPGTFPPRQAIEIKLAIYGGMMAMFGEMSSIEQKHGDDMDAAAAELEEVRAAISTRALRLNEERSK